MNFSLLNADIIDIILKYLDYDSLLKLSTCTKITRRLVFENLSFWNRTEVYIYNGGLQVKVMALKHSTDL